MKLLFSILLLTICSSFTVNHKEQFFAADNPYIQYTGRVDFTNSAKPKLWASGVYVQVKFRGTSCSLQINDEMIWGKVLNYLEIRIDDQPAYRIQLKGKENTLVLAENLTKGDHVVTICKNSEAENGYVEIVGFTCEKLLPLPAKQKRKMEFIGDSITCGAGSDESVIACGKGEWHDQHNAWFAYGPTTARNLNAQWHLSSVSGIGLMHSCCDKKIVMPQVFDKVSMARDTIKWDFSKYQPDVVTVCLGQNDGVQDSTKFCNAYVKFAKTLRGYYPKAKLIFLTSPMANKELKTALVKYINAVKKTLNDNGEHNIGSYFFTKQANKGCGGHPSLAEHKEIADELTAYVKKTMKW
ncbi:SGNH/GDSL hydrolase family protein [Pedobacter boryungensis]|uniref:SGNH/GDSL hydrolase family protein n=1 Tax=Pedobacter boryungensis TaxID=869962 RepID=A0ABX2DDG3_9SPHI|nr:SGNH/GDSL hydrolase family protein [Pedobacter boryungensis]NQX32132.1 SGNH/GDSL hydrolase family protein [Pedobacter boryungensis]